MFSGIRRTSEDYAAPVIANTQAQLIAAVMQVNLEARRIGVRDGIHECFATYQEGFLVNDGMQYPRWPVSAGRKMNARVRRQLHPLSHQRVDQPRAGYGSSSQRPNSCPTFRNQLICATQSALER